MRLRDTYHCLKLGRSALPFIPDYTEGVCLPVPVVPVLTVHLSARFAVMSAVDEATKRAKELGGDDPQ